jgi:hypothetical protein
MSPPRIPDDFTTTFDSTFAQLQLTILDACEHEDRWPAKVAAAIRAGLEFVAADPAAAQVLTNDALAHDAEGFACHDRFIVYLAQQLLPGRAERPEGAHLPEITERFMAAGVVMLVAHRLDQGREGELPALAPEAIQFVLTPYLGAEEARLVAEP